VSWAGFSTAEHATPKMEAHDRDGNYNDTLQVKIMFAGMEYTGNVYSSIYIYI
jgi:hypothetical protein